MTTRDPRAEQDDPITPRSGVDLGPLIGLLQSEDDPEDERDRVRAVSYLAGQLRELRKQTQRTAAGLEATVTHAAVAQKWSETARSEILEAKDELRKEFREGLAGVRDGLGGVTEELGNVLAAVSKLSEAIGTAPGPLDAMSRRASMVGELTAEEIRQLEEGGTGVLGLVARLVAGQARAVEGLARLTGIKAGIAAGMTTAISTAPSWGPSAVEFVGRVTGWWG